MSFPKTIQLIVAFGLILFLFTIGQKINFVRAIDCSNPKSTDSLPELMNCEKGLRETWSLIADANTTNKANLKALQDRVNALKAQIDSLLAQLEKKQTEISKRNKDFDQEYEKLSLMVRSYYIRSYYPSGLMIMLGSQSATDAIRLLGIYSLLSKRDRDTIVGLATTLADLQKEKTQLQAQADNISSLKKDVDAKAQFLAGEVKKASAYEQQLQGQIAALSARQQEIINARSGSFIATIGDSNLADDYNASINGFKESAPSGYFAVFAFGAYTHRKGMSQYGARGRAQSGQDYKTILRAYYGKEPVKKDTGGDINVDGFGSINFEDRYLMGIAEMPSSWNSEALKAQAVAARTYAYRYKTQGSSICTSEACQVFNSGKADNPPDAWKQAVQATKGEILEDVVTYYASTHGGYTSSIGWDTTNGSGGSNFIDNAYDKIGGSPWLYKAWYTQGYSVNSDKCGRSNPWLSPEEMADIVNAAIALKTGGIDTKRITPITTSCWGGNPYSMDELKNLVTGNGGISSANSVSVFQGDGNTNNVTINGVSLSGTEFKKAFNLRAPGRLSIPQSGFAFFNIEKR